MNFLMVMMKRSLSKRVVKSVCTLCSVLYSCCSYSGDVINDSIPPQNTSSSGVGLGSPIILFDSINNGIAFWHDDNNKTILGSFLPSISMGWNPQMLIVSQNAKNGPVASINIKNNGVLTWESKESGSSTPSLLYAIPFQSTQAGVIFGPLNIVSPLNQKCSAPVICIAHDNTVLAAWINESTSPYSVWIALGTFNPLNLTITWSNQQQIFQQSADAGSLAISINDSGYGTLIWREKITDFTQYHSLNFFLSQSLLTTYGVISLPVSATGPLTGNQNDGLVSVDGYGNAFACWNWSENTTTHRVLQYSVLYFGASSWSPLQTIRSTSNAQVNNQQGINSSGFGAVVWEEDSGGTPVGAYVATFQINNQNKTLNISNILSLPGSKSTPNVFVDRRSNVIASWYNETSNPYSVRIGFLPQGSSVVGSISQVSQNNLVNGGESAKLYFNLFGFGGVIWDLADQTRVQSARLVVYNPSNILFNAPLPTKYLIQ